MPNSLFSNHWARPHLRLAPLFIYMLMLVLLPHIATAQKKRAEVQDAILGVSIGAKLDEVRARLDHIGASGGRATRDGGRKEAWHLKETDFAHIALKTDAKGSVVWVSGFLRPGKEIPFSRLGDLTLAKGATGSQAIWNVETQGGGYRLVAKGQNGKAGVIYLLSLTTTPVE